MRLSYLTLALFVSLLTFRQKSFKPTIVILDPYETKYDSSLLTKIEEYTYDAFITPENEKTVTRQFGKRENIQIMNVAEFRFRKKMNFSSYFTLSLNTMLTYAIFGQTNKCIVILVYISSGEINSLKPIAKKHNVQWIVNPISSNAYVKDGNKFMTVRIQVFDSKKNKIVLDREYTGDTKNPGFELSCESGTLECTVNNVINSSLHDILLSIPGTYQN